MTTISLGSKTYKLRTCENLSGREWKEVQSILHRGLLPPHDCAISDEYLREKQLFADLLKIVAPSIRISSVLKAASTNRHIFINELILRHVLGEAAQLGEVLSSLLPEDFQRFLTEAAEAKSD